MGGEGEVNQSGFVVGTYTEQDTFTMLDTGAKDHGNKEDGTSQPESD